MWVPACRTTRCTRQTSACTCPLGKKRSTRLSISSITWHNVFSVCLGLDSSVAQMAPHYCPSFVIPSGIRKRYQLEDQQAGNLYNHIFGKPKVPSPGRKRQIETY